MAVSTHASAGDATDSDDFDSAELIGFQLTRPRGTRLHHLLAVRASFLFQLTRPRGTRHDAALEVAFGKSFNSRVRGGRDIHNRG